MKLFLREIKDTTTDLHFTSEDTWLVQAIERLDEKIESLPARKAPPANLERPVHVDVQLHQVDDVVVITGRIDTQIQLVCSRCAISFDFSCRSPISALYCKDPVMAGVAHLQRKFDQPGEWRPVGQNQGKARHAHDFSESHPDDNSLASSKDLDITYISEDFIDLADVLTEQIRLLIPFQPLCREDCKGMCSHCGADMNVGRCACAKLATAKPFSVLKDFKVK